MSRGLGWLERQILVYLDGDQDITRAMLADSIYQDNGFARPTRSQLVSYNRAIRALKSKGLIEEFGWPRYLVLTDAGKRLPLEGEDDE